MAGRGRSSPKVPSSLSGAKAEPTDLNKALTTALRPLVEQLTSLNQKVDSIQTDLADLKKTTQKTDKELAEVKSKTQKQDVRLSKVENERATDRNTLLQMQMERASYCLRFQSIPEKQGEDLKKILSDLLAPMTGLKAEEIQSDMDMVYRTYPEFIKKNNLPGEVMVRFSKRATRDIVLRTTNKKSLKLQDQEIKVLKDIPFEIRKRRKAYRKLTIWLQSSNISYRWMNPEGVQFLYKEKKKKIDTPAMANSFLLHCRKKEEKGEEESSSEDSLDQRESIYGLVSSSKESTEPEESDLDSKLGAAGPKIPEKIKKKTKKKEDSKKK